MLEKAERGVIDETYAGSIAEQTKQLDEGDGGSSEPSDDRNGLNEPISLNRYNAPLHALLERRGTRQSAADRTIAQKRREGLEKPTIGRLIWKDRADGPICTFCLGAFVPPTTVTPRRASRGLQNYCEKNITNAGFTDDAPPAPVMA
jgi:hypothetical protein